MGTTEITTPVLNLIPLIPHIYPPDPRWEARHCMTGYWFAPSSESWKPPAAWEREFAKNMVYPWQSV